MQTFLTQKLAANLSQKLQTEIEVGRVNFTFFDKLVLKDIVIYDQKFDTLFFTHSVSAKIDSIRFKKKKIAINLFEFSDTKIKVRKDSANQFNFSYLAAAFQNEKDSTQSWSFTCSKFLLNQSEIKYNDAYQNKISDLFIKNIYFDISELKVLNDSVKFTINELKLDDGKQLKLNHLSSEFTFANNTLSLFQFNLNTQRSKIIDTQIEIKNLISDSSSAKPEIDLRISDTEISFFEIAQLVPALKGMNQLVKLSGRIYGDINDLKGKNIVFKTGRRTAATFDFYLNDLTNVNKMYLFLDLKQSRTNFSDLSAIKLPNTSPLSNLRFPESFYSAGQITYKGNFSGFLSDFVAFGSFTSEMGNLTTDVSVVPEKGGKIKYQGKVATSNFQLGQLLQNNNLGVLSFDGIVDGKYNKEKKSILGSFLGKVSEFEWYKYVYKNIVFDGILDNKMFDGLLSVDDPNLKLSFSGSMNLNPEIPVFNFNMNLEKALPGNLNLSKNFPLSEMAFTMIANFTGNKLDNLSGKIELTNGVYKNRYGEFDLKGMQLISEPGDSYDILRFNSDYFDFAINGKYHFQSLADAFKKIADSYLPAFNFDNNEKLRPNNFDFQLDVKTLDDLCNVFIPPYNIETPFLIYGEINSDSNLVRLNGSIPGFSNDKMWVKNIFIGNQPQSNVFASKIRFGEILLKNSLAIYNLNLDTKIDNNNIINKITWTNFHDLTYSGNIETHSTLILDTLNNFPKINIEGLPANIYIADSLWQMTGFKAFIDSSSIKINDFNFFKNNEEISIEGEISENTMKPLSVSFLNIDLAQFEKYLQKNLPVSGIINGSAGVMDFYDQRIISSDLTISNFSFEDKLIGDVFMKSFWDKQKSQVNSELTIEKNERKSLFAKGFVNPLENKIDFDIDLDNLSLVILETVLKDNFSNIHGDGSGHIKVHGTPDKILMDGAVKGINAGLTIDYTQVSYNFSDTVYFKGDTIDFDNIRISDTRNNSGIFDGTLVHDNFKNMQYDLNARSSKIMAVNTSIKNNEQFFGQVVASGDIDITGKGLQIKLSGRGTNLPGTNVNISLEYENEIEQYDFIQFVTTKETEKNKFLFENKKTSDFSLDITVQATSDARAQLIYNSQIGDVIKAQGEGILKFGMDKEGNITLAGNYTIDKGDYLFTLQNVINKRFEIEQGGSLVWSGDPYTALIDINAVYKLKASLYDLLVNTYENIYQNQRIPVECKILLTENLSNPEIDFEIDFPTVESRIIDELQQYFSTKEEMNKQILSLLVLGKFYTPEYIRGTYEAQNPNVLGTTASELFSNQLSNWLSQINNNVDIGLNYRPGNQITNDEIELALSTQMFNDRVTLNGNIGNNVNPNSSNNSQIVGDFEVNVKLIPSGKVQFKAYNRSNNNLIYETAPYTQGIGLSFKEEYNTVQELLKKLNSLFKKD